jgi:hypothetical protein
MWKIVDRCPSVEVNERGEIRYRDTGKLASTYVAATGYIQVGVYYMGKPRTYNVHRLVAEAFIPNPDNLPQVNHKDENRANCHVENLEWCTSVYNNNYGGKIERLRKHCCKPVVATDKKTGEEREFFSAAEEGRQLNCNPNNITRVLLGVRKSASGYFWKYAEGVA